MIRLLTRHFFSCKPGVGLPAINFSQFFLTVGMKAGQAEFDTPINIKEWNSTWFRQGTAAGKKSESGQGGEWFAFTSVVPKVQGKVDLEMKYEFE
ncbi:MAG: hypothetical protein WC836_23750 [Desulfobacula sp.]|jgi:hypothetical protein